jgi:hypothetical protein
MLLNYRYILFAFSCVISSLSSQTSEFYESKNYFSLNTGFLFNHPIQQNKIDGVKRLASNDVNVSLSLYTFNNVNKHHGWQFRVGGGTQSVRFKIKDKNGFYSTSNTYSGDDGNYLLNINKTYNVNLSKKINTLFSFGPILNLNRRTHLTDSLRMVRYSDFTAYNIKPLGFGLYAAANAVYHINSKLKFMISLSYQRGFIKYREARITNVTRTGEAIFNYYGSGASAMFGLLFNISKKETPEIGSK